MSTRATYRFDAGPHTPAVTFYIHYDGYLEGAASYFLAAVLHENARGGLVAQFIRANDDAEFTDSHERHADTEFRYTVAADTHLLLAEKYRHDTESWITVFRGAVSEFVKQYEGTPLIRFRGVYLTHERAIAKTLERLAELKRALENKWTGNASSTANDVWQLLQLLIETWGDDDFSRLTAKTIDSADRYFALAYGWNKDCTDEEAYQRWVARFRAPPALGKEAQA